MIEDDPSAANLLRTYLEAAQYQVSVAHSGEAGLAKARHRRPDAILLDVLLPGMTGWQVLGEIKRDPLLAAVPVFIVTIVDQDTDARSLGATDYSSSRGPAPPARPARRARAGRHRPR